MTKYILNTVFAKKSKFYMRSRNILFFSWHLLICGESKAHIIAALGRALVYKSNYSTLVQLLSFLGVNFSLILSKAQITEALNTNLLVQRHHWLDLVFSLI